MILSTITYILVCFFVIMQNPEFGTANATHEAEAKIESLQEEIRQAEVSIFYALGIYMP